MPLSVYHGDTDGHRPNHADDARQSSNRTRHGKQQNHRTGCGQHRVTGRRGISGRRFSVDDERTRQQTLDTGDGQADHGEHGDLPGQPPAASNQRRNNADCGNCAADSDNQPGLCDGVHHAGGPGRYIVVQVFPDQFVVRLSVFGKHAPHHTPKPIAIRSRPNTTHSTRLEIRGRTVSGSSRAKPRSISDAPSASSMSSGLKSRKEPDVDADASEPETGRAQPMGQQRSTTSQAVLRLSRPD